MEKTSGRKKERKAEKIAMDFEITLTDNSGLYLNALETQIKAALEAIGTQCESHAKQNLTAAGRRDTGNLINSINLDVRISEDAVYVGTNVYYGKYVEYGTGVYGENSTGGGWWVYVDSDWENISTVRGKRYTEKEARRIVAMLKAKGLDAHMTQGQKPTHFLKKAVQDNREEYKEIIESILKNA
mgnify:CR=1 FL=1